jgi:hypothetical protein
VGGLVVTIASAYLITFVGLGGNHGPAALANRSSPSPLNEYVSTGQLPTTTRSSFYITVSGATPEVGISIDIYSPAERQVDGTFVRADHEGRASYTYPWPLNDERPIAGIWKIVTLNDETGASATAYIQAV